jgi:hypothetical protein
VTVSEILQDLEIEFADSGHHHCRPGWLQLQKCPFCGSDNFHLGINLTGNYSSCYKCGWHSLFSLLSELGASRKQAGEFVREIDSLDGFDEKPRKGLIEPKLRGPLLKVHRRYLKGRGFDPVTIERLWKIEGLGLHPRLSWRLYLPVIVDGRKVSWTTRSVIQTVKQRYISASAEEEAVNHRDCVYGIDFCRHSVVICEGPIDAWAIGPGGVALFGIDFSQAQIKALLKIPFRFVCFDSSPDAQRKAEALAQSLACFPGETHNVVIDAKDPGSASPKELRKLRKFAKLS